MVKIRSLRTGLGTLDQAAAAPRPKRADAELLTPEHRAWRNAVLKRAGYRCEWRLPDGTRCPKAAPAYRMVADHVHERADDGPLRGKGQCLCIEHNTLKGVQARTARHQG